MMKAKSGTMDEGFDFQAFYYLSSGFGLKNILIPCLNESDLTQRPAYPESYLLVNFPIPPGPQQKAENSHVPPVRRRWSLVLWGKGAFACQSPAPCGRYSPTFTLFSWLWVQMITDKLFIIRSTQFQGLYAHYLVCSWGFRPGPCKEQFKGSTRIWAGARRFLHGPDAKLFRQINIWHISTHFRVFHYPPSMLELHKC